MEQLTLMLLLLGEELMLTFDELMIEDVARPWPPPTVVVRRMDEPREYRDERRRVDDGIIFVFCRGLFVYIIIVVFGNNF